MTLNAAAAAGFNYLSGSDFIVTHSNTQKQFISINESLLSLQRNQAATTRRLWQLRFKLKQSSLLHLTMCRAARPDIFLASASAPNSGNVTGLLISGGGMIFLYLIANFVVPSIIMKDFQQNQTNEETKSDEDDDEEEDMMSDDDDE